MLYLDFGNVGVPVLAPQPVALVGILLAAALYIRAVRVLARRGRRVPVAQRWSFAIGLLLVAVALQTGIDPVGGEYLLSVHMAQHLLMADIAGPLLLLGVRAPLLYFFWPRPVLTAAARQRTLRSVWSFLIRPPVALTVWLLTLFAWHVPALYEAAVHNPWLHAAEHLTFVLGSMLAWWPLLDPTHHRVRGRVWKAAYVMAARTVGGVLGIILIVAPTPLYPTYAAGAAIFGVDPLTDQQVAGALMMAVDLAIVAIAFLFFLLRAAADAEERSSDRGVRGVPVRESSG